MTLDPRFPVPPQFLTHDGGICHSCIEHEEDRPRWGPGPWEKEPHFSGVFRHVGLLCCVHRGGSGAWCGYVGVLPGHPSYGQGYDDVDVDVHGGLTYASECQGHICHVPAPGEAENVWWFGFDCAHAFDLMPRLAAAEREYGGQILELAKRLYDDYKIREDHYWTMDEVIAETKRLAEQLAGVTVASREEGTQSTGETGETE